MKKSIVWKVLGAAMALSLVFSAFAFADKTEAAEGGEVSYEADVNGDGKIVVGYISKNFTDPFHAPINARAQEYFDQAVEDGSFVGKVLVQGAFCHAEFSRNCARRHRLEPISREKPQRNLEYSFSC